MTMLYAALQVCPTVPQLVCDRTGSWIRDSFFLIHPSCLRRGQATLQTHSIPFRDVCAGLSLWVPTWYWELLWEALFGFAIIVQFVPWPPTQNYLFQPFPSLSSWFKTKWTETLSSSSAFIFRGSMKMSGVVMWLMSHFGPEINSQIYYRSGLSKGQTGGKQ